MELTQTGRQSGGGAVEFLQAVGSLNRKGVDNLSIPFGQLGVAPAYLVEVVGRIIAGFLFLDWRALLERKKFTFNFRIWK